MARALAEKAAAEAEFDTYRDRMEDQVWTAYTKTETTFEQLRPALLVYPALATSFTLGLWLLLFS